MKLFKFFSFGLVLFGSFIIIGRAEECDLEALKQVADVVDVSVELDYSSLDVGIYDENLVTVTGLSQDIYAITDDFSVGFYYEDVKDGAVVKKVYSGPRSLKVFSLKCPDKVLKTIDLDLKKYNSFSDYDECDGIEEKLDVCSPFYDKDITYDQFIKAVNKFKSGDGNVSSSTSSLHSIFNFFKTNIWFDVILVAVVVGIVSFFVVRSIKKNKLD